MFLLRRFIKQLLVVFVIGFVIRKLLESSDPRAQRVGRVANRLMGSRFGVDAPPSRTRRFGRAPVRI